jgi:ABC-type proline/glycine betaine transport system ATPase subunit
MQDIIIEAKEISKLYGAPREEAMEMLRKGATKDDVLKKPR